jgi:hypothetical protein
MIIVMEIIILIMAQQKTGKIMEFYDAELLDHPAKIDNKKWRPDTMQ